MLPVEKVIVIGLDGVDWRLLRPWMEAGHLPTLARLVAEGASGPLRSTIRPESSLAWSSFATGVNPGRHGIFGFVRHQPGSYAYRLANGRDIRAPRFWQELGRQGYRVGLLNIPFTYPPGPVNGFLVSGMLTPGAHVPFTHPPELQAALLRRFEPYLFDPSEAMQDKETLARSVAQYTRQQLESALWLLRSQPCHFFAVVFTGPDRLQHLFWADMDPTHPHHNPALAARAGGTLLAHFQALDRAVAALLAELPASRLVLLLSDHGFNGVANRFYVNRWLRQQGWLAVQSGSRRWRAALVGQLRRLKAVPAVRSLKQALLPQDWGPAALQTTLLTQGIAWQRTRAYFAPDGGLRLNLRGREPEGIVPPAEYEATRHALSQALLDIRAPHNQAPVFARVYLREELYHGPFADEAPDLIAEPQREQAAAGQNFLLDGQIGPSQAPLFTPSYPYSANHAQDGILIAHGPGVASGVALPLAPITSLAPTVLAALGAVIPEDYDGQVIEGLFEPGRWPPLRYGPGSPAEAAPDAGTFSQEEAEAVASRLRGLGYME